MLSFTLILFSCDAKVPKDIEKTTDTKIIIENNKEVMDYQIIQVEDGYRLVFDDPSFYAKFEAPQSVGFNIDLWEDFSDRLLSGTLTLDEKIRIYYTFSKDEQGIIILDPYGSYEISHFLPHQINNGGIYAGSYYVPYITCDEQYTIPTGIHILSKDLYNREYDACFSDIDSEEKNVEYEKKLLNNEVMTCYNKTVKTEKYSVVEEYILSNDKKTVFIAKTYNDDYDPYLPYDIHVLVNSKNGIYFSMDFFWKDITEDLTDEFLFGFEIEKIEK